MVDIAVKAIIENQLNQPNAIQIKPAIKKPIFSNHKITKEEIPLGPEMRSTGETLEFYEIS
jgi:hypothetical protein